MFKLFLTLAIICAALIVVLLATIGIYTVVKKRKARRAAAPATTLTDAEKLLLECDLANKEAELADKKRDLHFLKVDKKNLEKNEQDAKADYNKSVVARDNAVAKYKSACAKEVKLQVDVAKGVAVPANALADAATAVSDALADMQLAISWASTDKTAAEACANAVTAKQAEIDACQTDINNLTVEVAELHQKLR